MAGLRIAFFAPHNSVWMAHWASELKKRGHTVLFLSILPFSIPLEVDFQIIPLRFQSNYLKFWCSRKQVENILRNFRANIAHAFYSTNYGILATHQRYCPAVVTFVGSDLLIEPKRHVSIRWVNRSVIRHAAFLNPVSPQLAQILCAEYQMTEKVQMFPEGVDCRLFFPSPRESRSAIRIISSRNFEPIYNHSLFISVVPQLLSDFANLEIHFFGAGSLWQEYRERLSRFSQVLWHGWQPRERLAVELRQADIYVSTSLSDGTSTSLLEALACGVFPVVSDIPANRDWIEDGINGFLVSTQDKIQLTAKLGQAVTNVELRQKAAKINLELIREKADDQTIVSHLEEIYQKIVVRK